MNCSNVVTGNSSSNSGTDHAESSNTLGPRPSPNTRPSPLVAQRQQQDFPTTLAKDVLMDNLQKLIESSSSSYKAAMDDQASGVSTHSLNDFSTLQSSTSADGPVNGDNAGRRKSSLVPFMLQSDRKFSSLTSTRVLNHLISCFVVGGEYRLCFTQMAALVLGEVSQRNIDQAMSQLGITNMTAPSEQLQILKLYGIIPTTEPKCELITKSNAERLIAALIFKGAAPLTEELRPTLEHFEIAHDCFGGCSGLVYPSLSPEACIECSNCRFLFKPDAFCRHSHSSEKNLCHWGFDSSNWPFYIYLPDASTLANNSSLAQTEEERLQRFVQSYLSRENY